VTCSSRSSRLGVAVDEERTRGPVFSVVLGDRAGPPGASRGRRDRCAIPSRRGSSPDLPAGREMVAGGVSGPSGGPAAVHRHLGAPPTNGDGAGSDRDTRVAGPRRRRAPRTACRFIPRTDRPVPVLRRLVRTVRCTIRPVGERCRYRIHVASPACIVGPSAHSFRGPRSWRAGWRCGSRGAATAGCPAVSVSRAPSGGPAGGTAAARAGRARGRAAKRAITSSGPPPSSARSRGAAHCDAQVRPCASRSSWSGGCRAAPRRAASADRRAQEGPRGSGAEDRYVEPAAEADRSRQPGPLGEAAPARIAEPSLERMTSARPSPGKRAIATGSSPASARLRFARTRSTGMPASARPGAAPSTSARRGTGDRRVGVATPRRPGSGRRGRSDGRRPGSRRRSPGGGRGRSRVRGFARAPRANGRWLAPASPDQFGRGRRPATGEQRARHSGERPAAE
jgi:hypothetical protein